MEKRVGLVFLHGSGDNGLSFGSFFRMVPLESFGDSCFEEVLRLLNIDIITPSARSRPYTPMMGEEANIWFDRSLNWDSLGVEDDFEDIDGINSSLTNVRMSKDHL